MPDGSQGQSSFNPPENEKREEAPPVQPQVQKERARPQDSRTTEARPENVKPPEAQEGEKLDIEEKKSSLPRDSMEQMTTETKKIQGVSTQAYLDIEEIHNGVLILKNGGMRMVLMVSAINFNLKSEAEQNAIIYSFQSFLNSLHFPIQIVMQSRRLDLSGYLAKLRDREKQTQNALLRLQMGDYISFVERLLTVANIMDKNFYVIVSYDPVSLKKENLIEKTLNLIPGRKRKKEIIDFENYRKELSQRVEITASSLGSMGLRAVQLNTQELAELFYASYNPESAVRQKIYSLSEIMTPVVEKNPKS